MTVRRTRKNRRGNTIHIPPGTYTAAGLAKLVGISKDTIERWRKMGLLPYTTQQAGQITVYIFGTEAVTKARLLAGKTGNLSDRELVA